MNLAEIYKNKTDQWETPQNIKEAFKELEDFNPLKINYKNSFLKEHKNYYCNPPFSNIEPFIDYMIINNKKGYKTIMLLPIRTCTNWFKKLLKYGCEIILIGRIKYSNKGFAPFDSMIVNINGIKPINIYYNKQYKSKNEYTGTIQLTIYDFIGEQENEQI